ncbi:MAG: Druantia anti-phage system protein DruA [Candidatus Promineifilaceae bacterium]
MTISGFDFTPEIIERIKSEIASHPEISRVQLSRAVCGILNWRSATGKLKEMSCRVALLKLERSGKLKLPTAHPFRNSGCRPTMKRTDIMPTREVSEVPLSCDLRAIKPVSLECITSASTKASREWNKIMRRYHYLGSGPLCGAQLRYLIRAGDGSVLGGLSLSAAAFTLSCRDRHIGWSNAARKETLHRIVCNSRFLILPYVNVPHLASHVLGMLARRIGTDWQERYGYEPVMLETFVDPNRFKGTSYRAANWEYVGKTTGRSRQDRNSTLDVGEKDVYIITLCTDARKILCTSKLCVDNVKERSDAKKTPPADWAEEEFGEVDLGDRRLNKRLMTLARDFWAQPQSNIPQACKKRSAMKAAYRFFENEGVTMEKLLVPHYQATRARIRLTPPVVLAVQDTTELNYATHPKTQGLGPVSTSKDGAVGLFIHDTLAITPQGVPLGLIDVQCWARDPEAFGKPQLRHSLPIENKESNKWLVSYYTFCCTEIFLFV